jgi:lysozyme
MKYSVDGISFTESFEGCKLIAYPDSGGVWTIGYGHINGVTQGITCTQEQAEAWLVQDIQLASDVVNRAVTVPLTQNEFNALVDFVFNIGGGAFQSSTMLRLLNAGDYAGAADQFERWDHCSGKVVGGLLRRRVGEESEFNTPDPS